jgi:hypothetical protein
MLTVEVFLMDNGGFMYTPMTQSSLLKHQFDLNGTWLLLLTLRSMRDALVRLQS